jgi:hypothetical protein
MHIPLVSPLTGTGMVTSGHQVFSVVESKSFCHDQLLLQRQSTRTESMETQTSHHAVLLSMSSELHKSGTPRRAVRASNHSVSHSASANYPISPQI